MVLRLLSRASDLATLQARLVAAAIRARRPDVDVTLATQSSEGDRDRRVALWEAADKGLFTTDLSQALVDGRADLVVHSWKDLPIASHPGTRVGATLERADPRDVLLVRREVVTARPTALTILTSSPRRAWQIERSLTPLLPWPVATIDTVAVRGNIPTRVAKLVRGDGDALVVAKAALDRLLSPASTHDVVHAIRASLDACRWMVLPLCVAYGCSQDAGDDPVAADAPTGDVALMQELRYVGEIREQDLVPGTRSVLTSHEGAHGWPVLTLVLDPGPGLSVASITYHNEDLAPEDRAWIDVGKWHYEWDSFQVIDDVTLDLDARTFDGTMIFVGAQLRGVGEFAEDWSTLDLVMQYDLVDPAGLVAWTRLGQLELGYQADDTG